MKFWNGILHNFKDNLYSLMYPDKGRKYTKEYKGNKYTEYIGDSNYIWILDAGHGGLIDGVYQTDGKRSPKWEDGSQLFEGVSNRDFVNRISKKLEFLNISHIKLVDNQEDTPLSIRTGLANHLYETEMSKVDGKKMIFISIHSDAWETEYARGWSVFTTHGVTLSDVIAHYVAQKFKQIFPNERLRSDVSDGYLDVEANFWVLRKTKMPAILTENFFMTNPRECKEILMTEHGRELVARVHYESIIEMDRNKIIG